MPRSVVGISFKDKIVDTPMIPGRDTEEALAKAERYTRIHWSNLPHLTLRLQRVGTRRVLMERRLSGPPA